MISTQQIKLFLLFGLVALGGCTTVAYKPVELPLPTEPMLTPITSSSVACLSNQTYDTVVEREQALRHWALQLQAIIKANNTKAH